MLLPILILFSTITLLTTAFLEVSFVNAKIAYQQSARTYADIALDSAQANFVSYAQQAVSREGPDALVMPPPANVQATPFPIDGTYSACHSGPNVPGDTCPFTATRSTTVTADSSATAGTDSAQNVQQQFAVERRISAAINVTLVDRGGATVAQRSRLLTLRTFASSPFATLTGARDYGASVGTWSAGQGDSAGNDAGAAGYGGPSDTAIHTQMDCQQTGSPPQVNTRKANTTPPANDGLPWGTGNANAYEIPCDVPSTSVDNFGNQSWSPRTQDTTGWHR